MAKTTYNAISGTLGIVISVGELGEILHCRGDIYHGQAMESPTRANLTAVHVFSPTCAYAVGEGGTGVVVKPWPTMS